jgi:DNA-binding MarR family transcriptional regulator
VGSAIGTQPPIDPPETDERAALIRELEQTQQAFERRALSAMAEPLIATPLTMQQLKVLTLIAIDPEHAIGHKLAALVKVSVATMSGLIDRLVDHGMVERIEDQSDRRVRRLVVTAEGNVTLRGLLSATGTMPLPVLRRLATDDLRALVQGLVAVDEAMRNAEDDVPQRARPT